MLCCVSRKSVEGGGSRIPPLIPLRVSSLNNSRSKQNILTSPLAKDAANRANCLDSLFAQKSCKLNDIIEEDEVQDLQPCTICGRTFKPQSLEKHARICEQSATKKRKPFDSAKQRIQGTELEEFLPKEPKKKIYTGEERRQINPSWKQTHDEFIKTIRAARADSNETTIPSRQLAPLVNTGAPTRANETGACPTCNRQFGIKAYDRHVAWCKERVTRMSSTPATNMAKERLEARMKYRAPAVKNRRITNREKYSPTSKNTNLSPIGGKAKGTISLPSCSKPLEYNHSNNNLKQSMSGKKNGNLEKSDINVASSLSKSRSRDRSTNSGMGSSKDCDPFLLAEKQMLDLLSDTCSDKSFPGCQSDQQISSSPYYLSHMSAFAKYPKPISLDHRKIDKRDSLEFDDLSAGGFSSDSTETNSITHERFLDKKHANHNGITSSSNSNDNSKNTKNNNTESNSTVITNRNNDNNKNNNNSSNKSDNYQPILGRRVIIDKSKALGQVSDVFGEEIDLTSNDRNSEKNNEKTSPQYIRPLPNRSNSVRAASAPKFPERKKPIIPNNRNNIRSTSGFSTRNNDNYSNLSGSNLSLSSIVSSEIEMKRSGSVFEDIVSSFEDDVSGLYPSLRSLLKSDSLCSPILSHPNASLSDDLELSSPDNCNSKADHTKISADSAYSSLNRKYFNGRSASSNHPAGKREEDSTGCRGFRDQTDLPPALNSKMSKFCHECGHKFPETAKFCCECGIQRLML